MSEPFLAEIRIMGFNFAPRGWAFCDGQILPIDQNQSLYSLLGTTYGGDGRTSFALPDMRGRVPIHTGDGRAEGQKGGQEIHTLSDAEMPSHNHSYGGVSEAADAFLFAGNRFAEADNVYHAPDAGNTVSLNSNTVAHAGGGQEHNNMQPYLTLHFCIAIRGLFPARN